MKRLILLTLITPLLFLASCGGGNDLTGTWKFSDIEFPDGKPAEATDEQIAEMKTMLKDMKYEFTDGKNVKMSSGMSSEANKGTYKVSGEMLIIKSEKAGEQKVKILEHTSSKLVLEPVMDGAPSKGQRVAFVMTK